MAETEMTLKVTIERDFSRAGLALFITKQEVNGERSLAKPVDLVFEKVELGAMWPEPTLFFNEMWEGSSFLDSLASELVRLGYAKDAIKETKGELSATKYHLEDMRKLALKE